MLLALDIGNTNITVGVFDGHSLEATARIATDASRMSDEYGLMISQLLPVRGVSPEDIDAAAMCSVVPPLTRTFVDLCEDYFNVSPLVVGSGTKTGIRDHHPRPP